MQLAHPDQEECSFFHAIDKHRTGQGVTVAMLLNVAQHGCNAVCHLFPFTKWILELTLGPDQAKKITPAFTEETIN